MWKPVCQSRLNPLKFPTHNFSSVAGYGPQLGTNFPCQAVGHNMRWIILSSYLISKWDQCKVRQGARRAALRQIILSVSRGMFSTGLYRPVFRPLCSLCKRVWAVLAVRGKRHPSRNREGKCLNQMTDKQTNTHKYTLTRNRHTLGCPVRESNSGLPFDAAR